MITEAIFYRWSEGSLYLQHQWDSPHNAANAVDLLISAGLNNKTFHQRSVVRSFVVLICDLDGNFQAHTDITVLHQHKQI